MFYLASPDAIEFRLRPDRAETRRVSVDTGLLVFTDTPIITTSSRFQLIFIASMESDAFLFLYRTKVFVFFGKLFIDGER